MYLYSISLYLIYLCLNEIEKRSKRLIFAIKYVLVLSLSIGFTLILQYMKSYELSHEQIIEKINSLEQLGYSRSFCAIVFIHYVTAGRIGDILKLTGRSFTSGYVCTLAQSKGSEKIVCYIPDYHDIIDLWRSNGGRVAGTYTKSSMYRIYKKVGLSMPRNGGKYASVTHNFRVRRAHDIYLNSGDSEEVTAALGHKSRRTAAHYIRDIVNPTNIQRGALTAPTNTNDVIVVNRIGVMRIK